MSQTPRLFFSSPHSGEQVPEEIYWLKDLPEPVLMCDVDRYVDQLYRPVIESTDLPFICAKWHRYFSDANRKAEDVDQGAVQGALKPAGQFPSGLIWQKTTKGDALLPQGPISAELYQKILQTYHADFHNQVKSQYQSFFSQDSQAQVYQLDLHSMPSKGEPTGTMHRDPGETRKEIVVSDQKGQSADQAFVDLIIKAYEQAGFEVGYNWPYFGGRVTQTYGQPSKNQHCVQVELRRDLYMDENTKQKNERFDSTQAQLKLAIENIFTAMKGLK